MRKLEKQVDQNLHRQRVSWNRRSHPCNNSSRPRRSSSGTQNFFNHHQPAGIPSWETEFCSKIGLFGWKRFTEAKNYVHLYQNILEWNDSAAEEAFQEAKNRFKSTFHGLPCNISLPNPDMFIDKVDWDSEMDPEQLLGLEIEDHDEEEENENENYQPVVNNNLPLTEIVPTGWHIDLTECSGPVVLAGLIVG